MFEPVVMAALVTAEWGTKNQRGIRNSVIFQRGEHSRVATVAVNLNFLFVLLVHLMSPLLLLPCLVCTGVHTFSWRGSFG